MLKKIFYSIAIFLFTCQYVHAEAVAGFQVQSTYLDNGKIKLNSSGATAINVDVNFTRNLVVGTTNFESANIYFKIVAINTTTGQIISDLTQLYNITTTDFGSNANFTKTYPVSITFSNLGVSAPYIKIALLWKSIQFPAPPGYPYFNVFPTTYPVEIIQSVFYNVAKSGSFTRNNCGSGLVGSSVTYTVPANTYNSTISQADADQKAQNDVNTNGQAYANAQGTCSVPITYYNVVEGSTFTRNNCGAGYDGSQVGYTILAGTYSSIISQADANQKAIDDVNANGQNYANAHGTCTVSSTNNDFDMESDYTYVSGSLSLSGNTVSGSLTFTSDVGFPSGTAMRVAEFRNDDYIPSGTRTFYSGSWSITITPSAERRIMVTWTGSGAAPSGNITINISYLL